MRQTLSIVAFTLYTAVILYHPLVMVSHMSMHALQTPAHQQVHAHHHFEDNHHTAQDGLWHRHGETETENTLIQIVFQCVPPIPFAGQQPISTPAFPGFSFTQTYSKLFLKQHTPPPQLLLS